MAAVQGASFGSCAKSSVAPGSAVIVTGFDKTRGWVRVYVPADRRTVPY